MAFEDEYSDGDLIYGLNGGRVGYIQRLGPGRYGNVLIVDDLNNQFLGTGVGPGMARVQALGTGGTGAVYNRDAVMNNDSPDALNFLVFMETHTKYDPKLRPGADRSHTRTKHGSKAGLEYTTKMLNKKVHFVLDKLNMEMVVKKTGPQDELGADAIKQAKLRGEDISQMEKVRDITGAELRWLYRHRKDDGVMNYVKFWLNYNPVSPPWESPEDWKNLWAAYKPKSEQPKEEAPTTVSTILAKIKFW